MYTKQSLTSPQGVSPLQMQKGTGLHWSNSRGRNDIERESKDIEFRQCALLMLWLVLFLFPRGEEMTGFVFFKLLQ